MFANLVQLITGRSPSPEVARHAFVETVHVDDREPRSPRVERLICWCWWLIALKHVLIIWACRSYPVPFHQLWVNIPTWLLGVLGTAVYYARTKPHRRP